VIRAIPVLLDLLAQLDLPDRRDRKALSVLLDLPAQQDLPDRGDRKALSVLLDRRGRKATLVQQDLKV
jgi:hypothetical protein